MVETTPTKTKTKIKTKTTTIAAMIVIATIIAFPLAANKVAFAAGAPPPSTSGSTMLKLTTTNAPVVIPLLKGLYDGKGILLITTEVSDKAVKDQIGNFTGFPVNYAANLTLVEKMLLGSAQTERRLPL
jgi:hypothetical protein